MSDEKNPVGRPSKFSDALAAKIVELAGKGRTVDQIANIVGVSPRTLALWAATKEEFSQALQEAKLSADELVVASLFLRANGYSHAEEKIFCTRDGDIKRVKTTKHYPPDTSAIGLWLRNRRPKEWQRGPNDIVINPSLGKTDEELDKRISELIEQKEQAELGDKGKK